MGQRYKKKKKKSSRKPKAFINQRTEGPVLDHHLGSLRHWTADVAWAETSDNNSTILLLVKKK